MKLSGNYLSLKFGLSLIAFIGLSACTTISRLTGTGDVAGESLNVKPVEIESFRANEPEPPAIAIPEFDEIPEDVQVYVNKWLNYFQGKGRDHMERYLSRSSRYERLMKRILRENGIPEDIIYIALIESGFSPRAISRSRAVGYWQFIRGTGKRYGLAINTFIDERRDPVLATQAAADYFKGLYSEFNSWFLSMASYNVGEGRVRKEINRNKTRDFWVLVKKRRLPRETLNYVPKFLAARLIAKNPEAYGFKDIPYEPPIEFETAHFTQSINMKLLADKINVDYAELKRLNPKYRGEVAPVEGNRLELRLPLNTKDTAIAMSSEVGVKDLVFVPDRGETDVYKVRSGDNLLKIARKFNTTVARLREINDFKRRTRLKAGRTIFVPIPVMPLPLTAQKKSLIATKEIVKSLSSTASVNGEKTTIELASNEKSNQESKNKTDSKLETASKVDTVSEELKTNNEALTQVDNKETKDEEEALYIVQDGDSLAEVALKNNMSMEELMELNSLTEGQVISSGIQLKVKKLPTELTGEPSIDELPSSLSTVQKIVTPKANAATPPNSKKVLENEIQKELSGSPEDAKEILHKVKPGESLYKIAQKYNTTVSAIRKANKLRRRVLRAGIVLKIPSTQPERKTSDSSFRSTIYKSKNI